MTEKEFLEFINAMSRRPKLYTPTGSFYEIISFLEGYGGGGVVGDYSSHSVFTPFLVWVAKKYSFKKSIIDWQEFRELFSSDKESLEIFKELYREFISIQTNLI